MDKEQLIKGEVKKAKPRNRKEWIKNTIIVFLLVFYHDRTPCFAHYHWCRFDERNDLPHEKTFDHRR